MAVTENVDTRNNDLESSPKHRNGKEPTEEVVVYIGKGVVVDGGDGAPPKVKVNGHDETSQNQQSPQEEVVGEVVGDDGQVEGDAPNSNGSRGENNDDNETNDDHDDDDHQHHDNTSEPWEGTSKLNPLAREFVPSSLGSGHGYAFAHNFVLQSDPGSASSQPSRRRRNNNNQQRWRVNSRMSDAEQEEVIKKTVYVSDIDQQVTEKQLARLFAECGQIVDCRVCGDPNSILRFAFIEFIDEESVRAALNLSGTVLGFYPMRVLPSKTAIAPVNPTLLPRSDDEREMCSRTIYVTNIDRMVTPVDLRVFFETFCGVVRRLRMPGDAHHATRIAFIEFAVPESAIMALNCSGAVLGSFPIRVSPSKTPVLPRVPRPQIPHLSMQ